MIDPLLDELRDAVRNGCRPNLDDTDAANLLHEIETLTRWRDAVEQEVILCEGGVRWNPSDPRATIQDLITWHVLVALNPQVSGAARELRKGAFADAIAEWEKSWPNAPEPFINRLKRLAETG